MVVWISHRGYKAAAIENSREAFQAAVAIGFKVLETDLRLTGDNHIVLHHDATLARLAGTEMRVAEASRRQLEKLDLRGGGRLLFLEEFFQAFGEQEWVFDIKPETGERTLRQLATLAKAMRLLDAVREKTHFVLWDARHERVLQEAIPGAKTYARATECWRAGLALIAGVSRLGGMRRGRTYALPPRLKIAELYTPEKIAAFHQRGARVLAFLPETDADVRQALACGVDEILTNGRIVS